MFYPILPDYFFWFLRRLGAQHRSESLRVGDAHGATRQLLQLRVVISGCLVNYCGHCRLAMCALADYYLLVKMMLGILCTDLCCVLTCTHH